MPVAQYLPRGNGPMTAINPAIENGASGRMPR